MSQKPTCSATVFKHDNEPIILPVNNSVTFLILMNRPLFQLDRTYEKQHAMNNHKRKSPGSCNSEPFQGS